MLSAFQLPKEEVDDFSAIIYEPLRPRHCENILSLVPNRDRLSGRGTPLHSVGAQVLGKKCMSQVTECIDLFNRRGDISWNAVYVL